MQGEELQAILPRVVESPRLHYKVYQPVGRRGTVVVLEGAESRDGHVQSPQALQDQVRCLFEADQTEVERLSVFRVQLSRPLHAANDIRRKQVL